MYLCFFQSLGLPFGKTKKPDNFRFDDNGYGITSTLQSGWNSARVQLQSNHPLESSIRNVSI